MSEMDDFLGRVRALLISLHGVLTAEECSEVEHLIDHGELGEGLRTLAWIIVEQDKKVPSQCIAALLDLSTGLVAPEDMPPKLENHGVGRS